MAAGYCRFHKKFLSKVEVKTKRCKCKANTNKKCKHYVVTLKQKYKNNTRIRKC